MLARSFGNRDVVTPVGTSDILPRYKHVGLLHLKPDEIRQRDPDASNTRGYVLGQPPKDLLIFPKHLLKFPKQPPLPPPKETHLLICISKQLRGLSAPKKDLPNSIKSETVFSLRSDEFVHSSKRKSRRSSMVSIE